MKNIMKNTIITLFTIVALASCGQETTETKSDSTMVDSAMVDSSTSDAIVGKFDDLSFLTFDIALVSTGKVG